MEPREIANQIASQRVDPDAYWSGVEASTERLKLLTATMLLAMWQELREGIAADRAFMEAHNAHPLDRWADDGGRA